MHLSFRMQKLIPFRLLSRFLKTWCFSNFRGILEAAQSLLKEQGMAGQKFFFLASDGWGKQSQVVKGIEDFAVGAITVELESKKIAGE